MTQILRNIFFFVCLMMVPVAAEAETVKGSVANNRGEAIPFATISVLTQDSTLLTGAITDENGQYKVEVQGTKDYIIQASYVGYTTAFGGPDFVLHEETEHLEEVEVKAAKPLIERQMDKLVLNVSASPLAAGSNGNDILRRAPGVRIDKDGNITVNGKSVDIWIDGKPSYLSGQQLKAMLDGTDGNTIEKIEIISNPSAKYDASGTGGIINIKTKKNMMRGLNGMLSAAYGGMYFGDIQRWLQMDYVSLNLNYRGPKTYSFVNLTQVYGLHDVDLETSRTVPANGSTPQVTTYSKSGYDVNFQYYMLKAGNDWYIDSTNTLGFILQVPYMSVRQSIAEDRNYAYTAVGTDTTFTKTHSGSDTRSPQHTANINFTHTFSEALERELTVNLDYNRYRTQSQNNQITDYPTRSLGLDINSRQVADIYSGKLDFQTKFWQTGMIECGVKYALSSTDNNMSTDSSLNGSVISTTPVAFRYQEHVAAAYISVGKQFGEHWSAKLGLRGEYTYSHGDWTTADSVTNKSYFNPFPTVYLGYTSSPLTKLQQPISVGLSYTRRIRRPSYWMLNPFREYIDAYTYQMGNTDLTPEFNNDVEVTFSCTQYLNMTFNFAHTQDMFSQKVSIMPDGMGSIKWINFGTCTTHGASVSLTELPIVPKFATGADSTKSIQGAWLSLTVNAGWYHEINRSYELKADGTPEYELRHHAGYVSGTLSAYLPKDWLITVDGSWFSPEMAGYNRIEGRYILGAGIRKTYMKKGLIFNLNLQDALRSMEFNTTVTGLDAGYEAWYSNKVHSQRVMASITWMFGQYQQHKQRKVGDMDELNRLGGGGGVAGGANK